MPCFVLQFVYPFTLEPHVLTLESSRAATIAAHHVRHEAYLKQREENKERVRREALHRIAPGFEPQSGPLVPTKVSDSNASEAGAITGGAALSTEEGPGAQGHGRQRSVMDDLVDHLAALDASGSATLESRRPR